MAVATQTPELVPDQAESPFAWPPQRPLLAAEWRHLAMLNYEIDPAALAPLVPAGTELDDFNGACFVSIVGFQFLHARFLGVAFPLHTNLSLIHI